MPGPVNVFLVVLLAAISLAVYRTVCWDFVAPVPKNQLAARRYRRACNMANHRILRGWVLTGFPGCNLAIVRPTARQGRRR